MAALREILIAFGMSVDASPLDKAEGKVDGFLGKVKQAGEALAAAFAVKKLWDFTSAQVALGDELGDAAVLMDLNTQKLEQWRYAANFAEISGQELSAMFLKISKSANAAGESGNATGKILKDKLKIDVKDFKSSEEVFEAVGIKLAGMTKGYERTALAAQLFGKSGGVKILQLFKDGKAGIEAYRKEFEELGGGMGEFAEQAGEVDEQQKRLDFAWGNLKIKIAGVLLPAFRYIVVEATRITSAFMRMVAGTKIIQTALIVLGAMAAAKAALILSAYAPIIGTFLLWAAAVAFVVLALEDVYGFFTGKNSLLQKGIDGLFGKGASDKVRAWASAVWELVKSVGQRIVAIFTDSTTSIFEKFQALIGFFDTTFRTKAREIFGAIGGDVITEFSSAITEVIGLFVTAADQVRKIFQGVFQYIGDGISKAQDGAANEQAKAQAAVRDGKPAASGEDIQKHLDQAPWAVRAFAKLTGFDANKAAPVRVPGATNNTTNNTSAPVVNVAVNVAPGTPAAQAQNVAAAAQRGTTAALANPNRAAAASLERRGF